MANLPDLIRHARETQQRTRAAYGGCPVGEAVLESSGKVYPDCNVESVVDK